MRLVDNIFNSMVGKGETAPYIYYDYLESDGNRQRIDTPYVPNANTRIQTKIGSHVAFANNNDIIAFGLRRSFGNNEYLLRLHSSARVGKMTMIYGNSAQTRIADYAKDNVYELDINKNVVTVTVNGVTTTTTFAAYSFGHSLTLPLFGFNNNGNISSASLSQYIGRFIISENDVLLYDFRPAVRIADGVAGMLDVVNNVFYTNANPAGDNFLYGNLT